MHLGNGATADTCRLAIGFVATTYQDEQKENNEQAVMETWFVRRFHVIGIFKITPG